MEGFLLVNEDTLVNSWNFGEENLTPTTVWHGNEHAMNVTIDNLDSLETDPQEIMKSMLGILHAFQFLENVLLSEHPVIQSISTTNSNLLPPSILNVEQSNGTILLGQTQRCQQECTNLNSILWGSTFNNNVHLCLDSRE